RTPLNNSTELLPHWASDFKTECGLKECAYTVTDHWLQAWPGPASGLKTLRPEMQSIELACLAMSGMVARMLPMSARRASTMRAASAMPRLAVPIPASMSLTIGSSSATAALMPLVEALICPAAVCVDRSVARMLARLLPMPFTERLMSGAVSGAETTLASISPELFWLAVGPGRIEWTLAARLWVTRFMCSRVAGGG